jgi:hypothetical protein
MADPRYYSYGAGNGDRPLSGRGDRRRACRYPVGLADGSLGWWEGSSFVDTPCRIIDLSLVGCLVETRALPGVKEQQKVWLRPLGVSPGDWTEGVLVAARKPFFRPCQVRIRFLNDLPYESFKPLVFGVDKHRPSPAGDRPEHEQDRIWR